MSLSFSNCLTFPSLGAPGRAPSQAHTSRRNRVRVSPVSRRPQLGDLVSPTLEFQCLCTRIHFCGATGNSILQSYSLFRSTNDQFLCLCNAHPVVKISQKCPGPGNPLSDGQMLSQLQVLHPLRLTGCCTRYLVSPVYIRYSV